MNLSGLVDEARFDNLRSRSFRDDLRRLHERGRSTTEEGGVRGLVRSEEERVGGDGGGGRLDLNPLLGCLVNVELSSGGERSEDILFQSQFRLLHQRQVSK